jgi:hypothetical protein
LQAFRRREARLVSRRDLRFIIAAIGNSELIALNVATDILSEVARRGDPRLIRSVFRALLAAYRQPSLRSLIRDFLKDEVGTLTGDIHHFCKQSRILEGDHHLPPLATSVCGTKDLNTFLLLQRIPVKLTHSQHVESSCGILHEKVSE